jgi:hypothetical protein
VRPPLGACSFRRAVRPHRGLASSATRGQPCQRGPTMRVRREQGSRREQPECLEAQALRERGEGQVAVMVDTSNDEGHDFASRETFETAERSLNSVAGKSVWPPIVVPPGAASLWAAEAQPRTARSPLSGARMTKNATASLRFG